MDNIFKRFTCLLLAFLMIMEVFSPVAALAAEGGGLFEEARSVNSTAKTEKSISDELFNESATKTNQKATRNKEEVHKKTSNKAKETGKAPDLIPAKKTKNDHESMNPAKQTKNDYEILVPAKGKANPEAKAAEEAKAKEEQAAKEKEDLVKIEKEKQEALKIEAERQAQAARANDAEAAAAEAEYREAHQKRLELEQLLEEKLKEKGLRDQKKQSEKSLNAEESNKLKNTNEEENTEEQEKGLLEKIKEGLGLTDLQRADKELKKALKNKKNGLEEIQALLNTFEDKYDLSREDQAKLMEDNEEAFRELIQIDSEESFRPHVFAARKLSQDEKNNLENKKFNILTRFDTSNALGPIQAGQFFKIHLDKKLTVKEGTKLDPIVLNEEVIAEPKYNQSDNTITYTIAKEIPQNIQVPLNIPVDYNTKNISLDDDGTFTIINKVSGLGVKAPKDLVPQKVDENGNLAGSIIEPGRHDVTEIIGADDSNYKISAYAKANPVVKDGELQGYNWTIRVSSDTDLESLGYKANFTTVKGSGLGEITSNVKLDDNPIKGKLGINDSKHHSPGEGVREITYYLYTPTTGRQEKYMFDFSVILTKKNNKIGAKRIVIEEGWPHVKVKEATPSRVGINNRTTILGEFTSEKTAKWTVTDAVSTGDKETKLPLETRKLEGNQNLESSNMAVYGLDEDGKMVVKKAKTNLNNQIPNQGTNPEDAQAVGNIAVYEYNTNKVQTDKKPISLSGVTISKYKDINVEQNWNLGQGLTMPEMTVKAVDAKKESTELGSATTTESGQNPDPAIRTITIEDVKIWNIENGGKATRQDIKIKQDFPTNKTYNGKTISYYENNNWYDQNKKGYFIHNRATVEKVPQYANFTLIKKGEGGKPLEGATFKLLGAGEAEITTDKEGKIHFNNIAPGDYKLIETKAPKGYKLNQETTFVNVDENGGISISGSSAKLKVGANPTITIAHNGYPGYMNAMHYARVNDDGSVTTYIYLKANSGTTNKDTRLNLRLNGSQDGKFNKTEDVKVYDVNPYYRESLKTTMIQQRVDQNTINEIGNTDVLTTPNKKPIRANRYTRDSFTGQSGYRITIPEERFANDWGFLVVANSPAGTSVTYDWLTDGSKDFTQNNARLQDQTVTPSTAEQANQETEITITNEKFQTRPVEIKKLGKDQKPIVGANFELKDADGNVISTATSQAADEKGKNAGFASFGDQPEGKYTIEETSVPDGYIKSDVIFDVTVDESNQVTYKPRFKSGNGTPVNGEDYLIEDEEQTQQSSDANVTKVSQTLKINESDEGDIGVRPQVWEAYRLESLIYNATIDLENTAPGQRFSIQFDRNLDFTQYFGEFPKVKVGGVDVADPYFDYTTNKLTYVYNEKSAGGKGQAKIELKGIIPSKYFAPNDGTYPFSVIVAPGKTGIEGQRIDIQVPADYGQYDYDGRNKEVPQSYYFRDVYKGDDGNWYVAALAYYNPDHIRESGEKELKFNWLSTNYQGAHKNFFTWTGNGNKPAFSLTGVKVYRTSPNMTTINAGNFDKKVNKNMPLSFGVRPEQDPAKYNLIYSRKIDPRYAVNNDRQGGVTLNYNPSQIQDFGLITQNSPLRIGMPAITNASKNGYIIEQTFKIDDMNKFNNLWRVFLMTNNDFKSSFITRANYNKAIGDQAGGEIPKFFSQKVALFNKKYTPGKFNIKKLNEADLTKTLEGASFKLEDENKNAIYGSSGQDGIVTFDNLKPGIYTLTEEKAPDKYVKSDKTWRVNVGTDGQVTIIEIGLGSTGETLVGDNVELQVTNKPVATKFTVYKKDNENMPLQGAKFKITTTDGKEVVTGTSDKNGVVTFNKDLEKGTYILEEESAPAGYNKLDKKWVVEVGSDNRAKVYNYIEGPKEGTNPEVNKSILGVEGTKWVDVAKRPLDGWILGDNRQTGYYNNWPVPYKLGTRIVGKNTKDKYVIQRYVINPEADSLTLNQASIHREKPNFENMDWYAGSETYKIFELDKAVDGEVEDIRLENYKLTDITNQVAVSKQTISGGPRLSMNFNNRKITKPIVMDIKVPYKEDNGGVGTGMDLQTSKGLFWKSDYYDRANQIVEGDPVVTTGEAGNIKGAYVAEGSVNVTNDRVVQKFSFKKVDETGNDAVTGATFSLKGPKKSDQDPGKEVWKRSGKDGMVNFDNLIPGIYHLTETGAAQGYEKSNTDWTVTVTKDGKIYIRDNKPGSTVPDQGAQWQKVNTSATNPNRHLQASSSTGSPVKIATKIIEVNKKENKFRQVYIINGQPENLINPYFELHAQQETRGLTLDNTRIVSMNLVDRKSTPENLVNVGEKIDYTTKVYVKNNDQDRIQINPKNLAGQDKTIALTIESEIPNSGTIGTGLDFINSGYNNHYWLAEWYDSFSDIKLAPSNGTSRSANPEAPAEGEEPNARLIVSPRNTMKAYRAVSYADELATQDPIVEARKTLEYNKDKNNDFYVNNVIENILPASLNTGLEFGDELVGQPVQATGWEKVDPNRSRNVETRSGGNNQTKITEINKSQGKYRQIFLVNISGSSASNPKFDIHAYPFSSDVFGKTFYGNPINLKVLSIRPVLKSSTIDNIQYDGSQNLRITSDRVYRDGQYARYEFRTGKFSTPLAIEVEYDYSKTGGEIGLGLDYFSDATYTQTKVWSAEKYSSVNDINYKTSGPKTEVKEEEVRTTLPIPTEPERRPNANMKKGEEQQVFAGQEGYRIDLYKVTYIDGVKQPNPVFVKNIQTVNPQPRVIEYGTKDEAQPQPLEHNIKPFVSNEVVVAGVPTRATKGQQISLRINIENGYEVERIWLEDEAGNNLQDLTNATSFIMPDKNVVIKATFKKSKFMITTSVNDPNLGSVTVDKDKASEGEEVTVTVTPKDDTVEITEVRVAGTTIGPQLIKGKYTFKMKAKDVHVSVTFNKKDVKKFGVGSEPDGWGTVSVDPTESRDGNAKVGEKVTFTLNPYTGYKATGATVTKNQGGLVDVQFDPDTNKGYFIMPDISPSTAVTVRGVFKEANDRTVYDEKTESIKYDTKITVDESLAPGEKVTDKKGEDGSAVIRYTVTFEKIQRNGPKDDVADPTDWPAEILQALKAKKQTGERISAFTKKEISRTEPVAEEVRVGKSDDPIDKFVPGPEDKLIKDGETAELVKITNKKDGINPKIIKRNPGGDPLKDATFTIEKMKDKDYKEVDSSFGEITAISDEKGNVTFKDQAGNEVKLKKGYYLLKETKAPEGYKKFSSDWKIEVKDDGGRMYAVYQGPEDTPSTLINDNKKSNAGYSADNANIKFKSRLTYIDPEKNTYVQRIYVDTRPYYGNDTEENKGQLNVQITPKYKRQEIDTPGALPQTIKDGVKTAYYSSYKLSNPSDFKNMNDPAIDKILRTYDLSNKNLSMEKTARWRPFDWGFDEDQLNLGKGVYIVDVEGYYDDVIITGKSDKTDKYDIPQKDLGKIDLHVDFYKGARHFKQLKLDENGNATYEAFDGASYQGGASQVTEYVKRKEGTDEAKKWSGKKDDGAKYPNFVGKEVKYNGKTYKTGIIDPPLTSEPTVHGDTSINLNPLYNSKVSEEIPKDGMVIENEEESYNITFSKHGRDNSKDDINSEKVTKNRLEGAVFKLQVRGPGGQYEDVPGTTVASAFNGYFGFRGLKPGRYRLMEVRAPEGYRPISDPILHFTIAYKKGDIKEETGEVTPGRGVITLEYNESNGIVQYAPEKNDADGKPITPDDGKLVDYVTAATAKNMGKIINEIPGKGKVTLEKYDDDNHLLPGAEFKLTRISKEIKVDDDPKKNDGVYVKKVGEDGKIVFDELPIGQYELEETKPAPGYQNKGKKWRFTVGGVGLDPYVDQGNVGLRDISKSVEMTSEMSVLRPDANDGTENEENSKIHPHKGHALSFKNNFKVKDGTAIKPGDYFTIKLTDNIDLEGIMKEKSQNLDLFADGVGTIAKAKYDKQAGTLTYIFTGYADQYNKTDFENTITAHINLIKVPNSSSQSVGMGIKDTDFTKNNIAVEYELNMAKRSEGGNTPNMTSKIVSFDRETGEFVQYFYINRDKTVTKSAKFEYTPSEAVTNLKFDYYALRQNSDSIYDYDKKQYVDPIVKDMPESFGVDENSYNLNWYYSEGYYNLGAGQTKNIQLGTLGQNNSLILKVTGKVKAENIASYDTYAKMYGYYEKTWTDYYGYYHSQTYMGPFVERTNGVRIFENKTEASAKLEIKAINPKNEIIFKKVDQAGTILPGAKFKLEKYYDNQKKWIEETGSEKTSDKDGLVKYETLKPGKYALIETEAPTGYAKIEGHIQEFTVGADGVITRQVPKVKPVETPRPVGMIANVGAALQAVASVVIGNDKAETVTEHVSKEPINVINYKEVEFEKVDANDHNTKLKGAVFEVHYKEKEDGDYQALKVKKTVNGEEQEVTMTATSGKDGKFKLPITKDGYYALVETKAPDNYSKIPGNIREFKLENGKVQTLEKDPLKASHKTSTKGQISSEILSVDKDKKTFKQRIIINPNHASMTIPSYQSYIRIKENDWKITPKYKGALKQGHGIGGLVNVAILKKDGEKTLDKLTKDDYRKVDAISFTTAGNITGSRYGLKDMLGITSPTDESITTTDSIVMEFTGKLDENNTTGTADQLFELVFNSGIDDSVNDKLDVKTIAENKPAYADHDQKDPIQVENRKAEYPHTGGMGTLIFTLAGLVLMSAAAYVYSRKRGVSYDD